MTLFAIARGGPIKCKSDIKNLGDILKVHLRTWKALHGKMRKAPLLSPGTSQILKNVCNKQYTFSIINHTI
jgi:hypothetical protein